MSSDRAQTTQDYVLGVSILLLTVLFVFGFTPTLFDSYGEPVSNADEVAADRAAEFIMTNFTVGNSTNTLKYGGSNGIHNTLSSNSGFRTFRKGAGLNTSTEQIAKPNVDIRLINSSQITNSTEPTPINPPSKSAHRYGDGRNEDRPSATVVRVVQLEGTPTDANGDPQCNPTCWLVVRVW